jgi:hypothetical protein
MCVAIQVKDATLKKVKTLEEQKEAVETERDALKVRCCSCFWLCTAVQAESAQCAARP